VAKPSVLNKLKPPPKEEINLETLRRVK